MRTDDVVRDGLTRLGFKEISKKCGDRAFFTGKKGDLRIWVFCDTGEYKTKDDAGVTSQGHIDVLLEGVGL